MNTKRLFVFLLTTVLMLAVGCSDKVDNARSAEKGTAVIDPNHPVYFNYERQGSFYYPMFAESEDAYYFSTGQGSGFFYYFDKETETYGALCNKPECGHDSLECNAFVGDSYSGLFYNNHYLFWIGLKEISPNEYGYVLWSMNLETLERSVVREFNYENYQEFLPRQVFIHKGMVYIYCVQPTIEDGIPHTKVILAAASALGTDNITALFEKEYEAGVSGTANLQNECIYIEVNGAWTEEEMGSYADDNDPPMHYFYEFYKYSIDSGESLALFTRDQNVEEMLVQDFSVVGDKIFFANMGEPGKPGILFCLEDGNVTEAFEFSSDTGPAENDAVYSAVFIGTGAVYATSKVDVDHYLCWIVNFDGETLYKGEIPLNYLQAHSGEFLRRAITFIECNEDSLILRFGRTTGDQNFDDCIVRFKIAGDTLIEEGIWAR